MANTSATGGYLLPMGGISPGEEEKSFRRVLQAWIAGCTGLDLVNVRPRWQPVPPNQPAAAVDWCAFGTETRALEFDAYVRHDPAGIGRSMVERGSAMDLVTSFYGPGAFAYADRFASGIALRQNRAALRAAGIAVLYVGNIVPAPALVDNRWLQKADLTVRISREINRVYGILNFTALPASAITDTGASQDLGCIRPQDIDNGE